MKYNSNTFQGLPSANINFKGLNVDISSHTIHVAKVNCKNTRNQVETKVQLQFDIFPNVK